MNVCFNCFLFIWWKIVCLALSECDIDRLHQIEKWIIEHVKQSFRFLIDKDTPFWWFLFMPTYYGILHWFLIHPSEIWLKWQFYFSNRKIPHLEILFKFLHAIQFTWIDPISFTCIDIDSNGEPTTARQTNNGILPLLQLLWLSLY